MANNSERTANGDPSPCVPDRSGHHCKIRVDTATPAFRYGNLWQRYLVYLLSRFMPSRPLGYKYASLCHKARRLASWNLGAWPALRRLYRVPSVVAGCLPSWVWAIIAEGCVLLAMLLNL